MRLRNALVSAFKNKSKASPLVLFVEDVQWADPETMELCGLLCESLERDAMGLIMTCRSWDLAKKTVLEALLNPLLRDQVHKIDLQPLRRLEAQTIALDILKGSDARVSEKRLARVFRLAEGNPLYLKALLRVAIEHRNEVPDVIRIMAEFRLRSLDAKTERMILVSSAFIAAFTSLQLAAVLGWPQVEVVGRLQDVCLSQLVIEVREGY